MERKWVIEFSEGPEELEGEVASQALDLVTILMRLGGVGVIAPHRVEIEPGEYAVDKVLIRYHSYAPGLNLDSEENGHGDKAQAEAAVKAGEEAAEGGVSESKPD